MGIPGELAAAVFDTRKLVYRFKGNIFTEGKTLNH
jgi:hypothetical protein